MQGLTAFAILHCDDEDRPQQPVALRCSDRRPLRYRRVPAPHPCCRDAGKLKLAEGEDKVAFQLGLARPEVVAIVQPTTRVVVKEPFGSVDVDSATESDITSHVGQPGVGVSLRTGGSRRHVPPAFASTLLDTCEAATCGRFIWPALLQGVVSPRVPSPRCLGRVGVAEHGAFVNHYEPEPLGGAMIRSSRRNGGEATGDRNQVQC